MARILIIDDDKMVLNMLRQILEGAGHTVVEAPNGEVAMRLWREQPADLIITDILMPEKDGLEVMPHREGNRFVGRQPKSPLRRARCREAIWRDVHPRKAV